MPFEKGHNKAGGRQKGTENKVTGDARAAIAAFVEANTERLNKLLEGIEKEDGSKAAFDAIMSVCEYHIPKLARQELTGKDGAALIPPKIEIELVTASKGKDT